MIDSWAGGVEAIPAGWRAIAAGAAPEDIAQMARAVAYETVFAMLTHLDGDGVTDGLPAWALIEADPSGKPTGRVLGGLHEDLLATDPSGRDGRDLWE